MGDGPTAGVSRQEYPIRKLQLTPMTVKLPFNSPTRIVRKEMVANKIDETWAASTWAKRNAIKALRAGLTDLDRFKLRKAKTARNKIVSTSIPRRGPLGRLESCKCLGIVQLMSTESFK